MTEHKLGWLGRPASFEGEPDRFFRALGNWSADLGGCSLSERIRLDAVTCMQRYLMVPTIRRYARYVSPTRHRGAAREVVRQVLGAIGPERAEVSDVLAAKYPLWAEAIVRGCLADDWCETGPEPGILPSAVGESLADGKPRFVIGRHLASGSSGAVFAGSDRSVGRRPSSARSEIVIKLLQTSTDSEKGWRREASVAARVSTRCGIRVIDSGLAPTGHGYIVMERVEGSSLFALAAKEQTVAMVYLGDELIHLATAIASLHREGYQHGDIHPANVMLDRVGQLRLLDYGNGAFGSRDGDVRALGALSLWLCLGYLPPPGSTVPWQWSPMRAAVVDAAVAALNEPMTAETYAERLRSGIRRARVLRNAVITTVVAIALGGLLYLANRGQSSCPGARNVAGEEVTQPDP